MPILTLAITEEGWGRLKRRAELQHVSVRQYCIWLLAHDAAKAEPEPEPEPETVAA